MDPSLTPRWAKYRRTRDRNPRRHPRSPQCARTTYGARRDPGRTTRPDPTHGRWEILTSRPWRRPPSATALPGNRRPPGSDTTCPRSRSARSSAPATHGWCASGVPPGPALCAALRSHAGVDQPLLTSPNSR
ncbi:hypothetical protein CCDC5180_1874 [Mycobacterium tuberculosis CCDC5180]|nr:hypothetical protein CCDC5180_1874 [Mycobacterium tuberculosis CCDC5180]